MTRHLDSTAGSRRVASKLWAERLDKNPFAVTPVEPPATGLAQVHTHHTTMQIINLRDNSWATYLFLHSHENTIAGHITAKRIRMLGYY